MTGSERTVTSASGALTIVVELSADLFAMTDLDRKAVGLIIDLLDTIAGYPCDPVPDDEPILAGPRLVDLPAADETPPEPVPISGRRCDLCDEEWPSAAAYAGHLGGCRRRQVQKAAAALPVGTIARGLAAMGVADVDSDLALRLLGEVLVATNLTGTVFGWSNVDGGRLRQALGLDNSIHLTDWLREFRDAALGAA